MKYIYKRLITYFVLLFKISFIKKSTLSANSYLKILIILIFSLSLVNGCMTHVAIGVQSNMQLSLLLFQLFCITFTHLSNYLVIMYISTAFFRKCRWDQSGSFVHPLFLSPTIPSFARFIPRRSDLNRWKLREPKRQKMENFADEPFCNKYCRRSLPVRINKASTEQEYFICFL